MQSHFRGPFKKEEIVSVINKMADVKSPEIHGITAEEIKVAGKTEIDNLQSTMPENMDPWNLPRWLVDRRPSSPPYARKNTNWTAAILKESAYSIMLAK